VLHQDITQPPPADAARLDGLDGLRGLAMLGVIFCHLQLLTVGWTGLSSFFILSGFLITRILLSDRARSATLGGYFRRFYIRRLLRVFPIYYAYLIALAVGTLIAPSLAPLRDDLAPAFLYYFNIHMISPVHEHTRMLDHLWSLSVEEQFYIVWPWLVAFVPRRALPYVCLALVGSGPLLRQWACDWLLPRMGLAGSPVLPNYVYILTTSQIDAFALGALINFVRLKPRDWQVLALLAAVIALGFAVNGAWGMKTLSFGWPLFMPRALQWAWGYTVIDLFWFVVICAILAGGGVTRFFSTRVLDFLGKRSYSTYIVHFPILALLLPFWQAAQARFGIYPGTLLFALPYLAVVFAVSSTTYRFIELPISELKERFRASRKPAPVAPIATSTPGLER
jgi:peptidoglycan/LPS O-acetylase OafA/YrhL